MAKELWGNVYYNETYAGRLEERPGGRCVFTYDPSYLEAKGLPIAYALPLSPDPYISERGLHPFFDNLVAEGWFRNAQAKALGINPHHRFALLLGFGFDLAGMVHIADPEPAKHYLLDHADEVTLAALRSRASISGIQRKLLMVKEGDHFRPVKSNELSTHIAKLASGNLNELLELEYLTTLAVRALLPDDDVVDMVLTTLPDIHQSALIIPRFDRTLTGKRLRHFEEFNQLLNHNSGDDKYEGDYEDMGRFILNSKNCAMTEAYRLYRRILVCFLVGNTDAHFKNFAMFHSSEGLSLTPLYDLVASSYYPEYQSIALRVCGLRNLQLGDLNPKQLIVMASGFGVKANVIELIYQELKKNIPKALAAIDASAIGSKKLRTELMKKMEKRWNGSFDLIGKRLSKKLGDDGKSLS